MKTGIFQRTEFISKGRKTSRNVLGTGERAPCGLDLPPSRPPAALLRSVTARGERAAAETPARPALGTGGGPGPGLRHTGAGGGGCPGPAGRGEASQESLGWLAGGPSTRSGTGGGSAGLQSVLGGVTDRVLRKGPCNAAGVSCGLTGSAGLGQRSLSPLRGRAQRTCQGPEMKPNDRQEAE